MENSTRNKPDKPFSKNEISQFSVKYPAKYPQRFLGR